MKTAIEWFVEQMSTDLKMQLGYELIEQAISMEKEQITSAYRVGKVETNLLPEKLTTGQQYYNETYSKL